MYFVLSCGIFCLLSQTTMADWKEFRGPTGQGEVTGAKLPVSWSDTDNVLWKSELEGLAWSSPVIVGDQVYLTSAVNIGEEQLSLRLLSVDLSTGDVNWDKEVFELEGKVKIHKKNSHASPTPIIEDDRIYVHFGPYGTACLSLKGEVIWKQKLEYKPVHGNGGSPALAGDVLVICCDGGDKQFVIGLDKSNGEILWNSNRDTDPKKGFSFSTPLIIEVDGQVQAVCPGSDAVFAYDPKTGDEIWRCDYPGGYSVTPRPVYGQGLVFVCTGFNKPLLLAIDPAGSGNVTETHLKWELDRQMPHSPSPILVGEELYVVSDSGIASCIEAKTGEIHWQERVEGKYSASPTAANGLVYFQDEEGTTVVVKAAKEFEEVSRNSIGSNERTFASFAVEGNSLLLRSENHLYRIGDAAK
ncbi:MAG: PQQ-binding-like beta-propeller repeat protein [Planctomicrobium sp.]|nr:PQQ-binding-like beta-propeller repeat protein [Planctomicrobium sp.]